MHTPTDEHDAIYKTYNIAHVYTPTPTDHPPVTHADAHAHIYTHTHRHTLTHTDTHI
jgi:hypothetical protein